MENFFKKFISKRIKVKQGIELQPYYQDILNKISSDTGLSNSTILEEGLKLYCQMKNISTVKLSEQEERFNKFRKDLESYLLDNLNEESPVYKETAYWCSCIKDRELTDKALDYNLRKIVGEMYKKPREASIRFVADLKVDRREIQTLVINFLKEIDNE